MISAFERFSLLFLAGAMVFGIGGAIVVRMPVAPPAPATFSASTNRDPETPRRHRPAAANDVVEPAEYDLEAVAAGAAGTARLRRVAAGQARSRPATKAPGEESWRTLLPLVLLVNEDILADRKQLWSIRVKLDLGERLSPEQRIWLDLVAERYAAPGDDLDELARRIDVVPPSMVAGGGRHDAVGERGSAGRRAKSAVAERAA